MRRGEGDETGGGEGVQEGKGERGKGNLVGLDWTGLH